MERVIRRVKELERKLKAVTEQNRKLKKKLQKKNEIAQKNATRARHEELFKTHSRERMKLILGGTC